ncbi:dihydrolipoyllysine-residue acetyltransferase component 2 of pyruvate dehydrogenase complex, mitochondrial-like [Phoenix dactylifera]|uniref:Acetyltransferase component of pyruvate dehydrogenase complex n=1 Tax=Phoenix dactylifera TaxID=42345 RepID=A0A8B7D0B3_PHODC|nr:dihydrolipoyllysine-residue acetyltransferase component 2 of pyruvate dehydrogenase complex, mitochondrial-like [Phoenix dactylifera]XP_008810368.2 dihydrolipoyllysine-residue acetyltransferase component 2 of pyruvate dehydrogenase complex, mitochondrial-like [Phoenix dactylifera]
MTIASRILRHSRKLGNAQYALQNEPAVLGRYFSKDAGLFVGKRDDISRSHQCGLHKNRDGDSNIFVGGFPFKTNRFEGQSSIKDLDVFKISSLGLVKTSISRRATKMSIPMAGMGFNSTLSCMQAAPRRCFSSNSDLPPHQEIGMPSLSPTMTEGNIARWLKKEGDKVSPGEVLCEVETDKATVEMECMEEGYVAKIIRGDGAKDIKVGEVIAITVEEEDDIAKFKDYEVSTAAPAAEVKAPSEPTLPVKEEQEPVKAPEPKVSKAEEVSHTDDRMFSSPLARKLAEDNNVPLSSIKGTGPDGRILKADIEDYLASTAKGEAAATQALSYVDIPNSQIRKVTASRLLLSKQTIPHYYLTVDTRVDELMELRGQLNSLQEASGGKRISVNDLVIKAAALALRKVPQCNSSWMNDFIRQYHNVNINVAVQTDNGLFVPVIRDADKKGLSTIAEEVKHLAQKAKDNSLKPADYEGGTFAVSNLGGPFGIKQFCAIINPPQSGILAVGSAEKRVIPGAGPDQFEYGSFMSVTLSCDHRVIDGAIGAEWLKAFKGYIENPYSMLL